jgi:hypothetical protein
MAAMSRERAGRWDREGLEVLGFATGDEAGRSWAMLVRRGLVAGLFEAVWRAWGLARGLAGDPCQQEIAVRCLASLASSSIRGV